MRELWDRFGLIAVGLLAVLLVAGGAWFISNERNIGAQRVIDADARARSDQREKDLVENKALQGAADVARKERDDAKRERDAYISDHPLHVFVCKPASHSDAAADRDPSSEPAASEAVPVLQPEGQSDTGRDVGPALSGLFEEADEVNDGLRECAARLNDARATLKRLSAH